MADTTLLVLAEIDIPPYSARGISQELRPVSGAGNLRRTVNGALVDLSASQFRKYQSAISCSDQVSPSLNGVWPGMTLTVDCVSELCYKTAGGSPSRTVVSGSSRVEGDFTFFRPRLVMKVVDYRVSTDEWGAEVGWTMDLMEV
jgi:hypothetical protein